ncbi:MAG: hypothetical protein RMJ00_02350 [Nitrososphaerota archaeon]|nr:hypothetical protein [Candidatus Bathyarchaeota archaeon]MCX8162603.1 hypothetical protein [Candidatus Bathyarchaeota archaeon]MDW8061521.1 hypothetical protein [Nitrososphaerota archaeon]
MANDVCKLNLFDRDANIVATMTSLYGTGLLDKLSGEFRGEEAGVTVVFILVGSVLASKDPRSLSSGEV